MSIFKTLLNLVAPGSGTAVDIVSQVIKGVTGQDDETEALKALESNPGALAEVQKQLSMERVSFEEQATAQLQARVKNLDAVNATMRVELERGDKFQKYWRPLNGYLFGVTLFLNYGVVPLVNAFTKKIIVVAQIPELVFVAWAGVVGVAVASRGKEKLAKLGNNGPSLLQSLVSGFKK